jgi:hypothetical protein
MPTVIVDTNVFGIDSPLAAAHMRRLLDEAARGNLDLVVPELVVREAINSWFEKVRGIEHGRRSAVKELRDRRALPADHEDERVDLDATRQAEDRRVRDALLAAGATIAPFPAVGQGPVVQRALDRRQPFTKDGKDGYRDTVLWETVLEIATAGPVIFVSRDARAFYEKGQKEGGIASDLAEEVADRCGVATAVTLIFDPDEAVTVALRRTADEAQEARQSALRHEAAQDERVAALIAEALAEDEGFVALLSDGIDEAVRYLDLGTDLRPYGVDADVYGASVDIVEEVTDLAVVSAHQDRNGDVICEISADLRADVEISLHPGNATVIENDPGVHIIDFGYGTPTATGSVEVGLRVVADVVIDPANHQLKSLVTVSQIGPGHERVAFGSASDRSSS